MTTRPDLLADRRAELARRRAALSPEQHARLAGAGAAPDGPKPTIQVREANAPVPMSFSQELLWRFERASPGHTYNVPRAVRLAGAVDMDALQRALDALVARHEALRTTFALVKDEPRQIVNAPAPVAVERFDVSDLPNSDRESAARTHMRNLARQPFDLEHDPQLRAAVIRLAEEDHVLQLMSHHVASDGWSGNIIMRELGTLYEGFRTGAPAELSVLPAQYADFAVWQRRTLAGDRLEGLLDYWRGQLADSPALLDLPTDRPRPTTLSFEGSVRTAALPIDVVERLHALARSQNATSFMVLLATLYVLLARYTREEEIVVGTPVAGRPYPELEGVVGFFTNTLLLRASLRGNPTFRQLVERVRAITLGAYDHQEIPLETLLGTRGPNGRPLATMPQVVFSTEDPDREDLRLAGTSSTRVGAALGGTKFDLQLWVAERPDGLRLVADFRTELFDDATIDRMLRHYGVLLAAAVAAPDTPVYELPIVDAAERHRTLVEWNDTDAGYPEQATIHGLIEAQVRQRPDSVAIEYAGDGARATMTYRELDRQANRVAHALLAAGVKPDDRVAVCLERSLDIVVATLGVLKSGGAYLPIDPHYPDDRIEFMVQDAGATLVLIEERARARLGGLLRGTQLIAVGDAVRSGASDESPGVAVSPRSMAYVIYTSGSTGRPKGVMVEHRNVTRLLVNDRNLFDFDETDVWTVFHSFAFDFSVWELYGALVFGGRAIVVPLAVAQSPTDFLALLEQSGTTVLNQVPSAFYGLMDEAVLRRPTLAVRYVIFGGEALKPALLRPWHEAWPSCRLINMFGITETTVHVTYKEISDDEIAAGVSNIGRAIPTLTAYVLDDWLQPVPVGVTGEICVGGLGVARGYLNRPELSSERFVPDPFGRGERLYRSGDLGRLLPNGEMEYLGRRDHQVKLRGHRIELGEIESALTQHLGVAEAVVVVREDVPGDQRLVAYVVATGNPVPAIAELRDWVRRTLPDVMVPAAVMFLDRFPLTSNGKVDRKALPALVGGLPDGLTYQSPRSTIEHEVAQIFERLLNPGRPIGAFDDFFESGGHSLLAIQMIAEIERVRGQRVPLAWLFASSTVASLAARLGESMMAEQEPPLIALHAEGSGPPVAYVHGDWTGGGWYSRRLAAMAVPDSPFFVLPTIGADDETEPWTIEGMAARHVAELRKVQPGGPYRLVGFCVGGIVAYEMARQLRAAGERVDRLVVIDSSPVNAQLRRLVPALRFMPGANAEQRLTRQAEVMRQVRWAVGRVTHFDRLRWRTKLHWIVEKVTNRALLVGRAAPDGARMSPATDGGPPAAGAIGEDVDRDAFVLRVQSRAASAYIPGRFDGPIDLIWAEGAPGMAPRSNPIGGWRLLTDEVRLHRLPSGHIGLITNNLPMLGEALRTTLEGEGA